MQSVEQNQAEISDSVQGETPDTMEVFFSELGDELFRNNLAVQNDVLKQLLTASISLLAGGIVFLKEDLCNNGLRISALGLFFIAVVISLIGVHPFRNDIHLGMPYEIKKSVDDAVWWKDGFIWLSSIFIVIGLLLALVGIIFK